MNLFFRGLKCLRENGFRYTVKRLFERKFILENYYDDLRNRVNTYQGRYPFFPRKTALRLIWWNFKQLFKKHTGLMGQTRQREACEPRKGNVSGLSLTPDNLNIGFWIKGGFGDFLVMANYIYKFRMKYGYDHIRLDVITQNYKLGQAIFKPGVIVDNHYPEEGYADHYREYDVFISMTRYPNLMRRQLDRIAEFAPELLEYVFLCERFRAEHSRFFTHSGITDGQGAKISILENRKRIHQPDIYGYLGVTEKYEFPLEIYEDETAYLEELGLLGQPFITLHRGCDTRYSSDSVKLWPLKYYNILIRLLKARYPEIKLVQIGVSHDRCLDMKGVDYNLVEKTDLEQVKILLKNSLLHIDGEGGMVHLRHAIAEKTSIVLFGPTSPEFFGYGENINMRGNGCETWCEWAVRGWMEKCLKGERPACMESIIPEDVMEQAVKVLEGDK